MTIFRIVEGRYVSSLYHCNDRYVGQVSSAAPHIKGGEIQAILFDASQLLPRREEAHG